jgi:hypothetical protein
MKTVPLGSVGFVMFCALFLPGTLGGQDPDFDRPISSGDTAMAKQQYAEAETSYRAALAIAEKRWKKDARISVSLLKLAESCNARGKQVEAESLASHSSITMDGGPRRSHTQEFVRGISTAHCFYSIFRQSW